MAISFTTKKPFKGHVYVKGHFDRKKCRTDATLTRAANLSIPFAICDVQKKRSVSGIYFYFEFRNIKTIFFRKS